MLFSRSPTAAAILYDAQQHQQSHHHDVATAAAAAVVKRTLFTGSYARDGTIFMSFAIAITVLRTYSRWKMVGFQGFRADDFLVWLALVSSYPLGGWASIFVFFCLVSFFSVMPLPFTPTFTGPTSDSAFFYRLFCAITLKGLPTCIRNSI